MSNSSLIILGLLVPLLSALGSYVFQKNINLRDSLGVIGGIIGACSVLEIMIVSF